ncbi:MAG: YebC/PmpR family DNA-binding transcriptional regulator [Caldisericia bacterium]|nr:YebC/PmpR family DNA-binding transcriptional regulator [Caldisericia bacterium]
MSGHSKWHNIKGKKTAADAARGRLFTKIGKEVTIAAREGGGNPDSNPKLRAAIEKARSAGMPSDNIKRAIQRGTGELNDGSTYEELVYEGYGPSGVAVIVEVTTDNKNRTMSEIRKLFSKFGGSLGEQNCVSWMFSSVGKIVLKSDSLSEEEAFDLAMKVNASDVQKEDEKYTLTTTPENLFKTKDLIEKEGFEVESSDIIKIPNTSIKLEGDDAQRMMRLMSELEDHDDVQRVFANFEISDEEIEKFLAAST